MRRSVILISFLVGVGCSVTTETPYPTPRKVEPQPAASAAAQRSGNQPQADANTPAARPATRAEPRPTTLPAPIEPQVATDIELVSAGAEPRSPLRWSAKLASEQRLVLTVKPHMNLKTDGVQVIDQDLPPMTLQLVARVASVADGGAMHLAIEVAAAELDASVGEPRSQRATERGLATLRAMRIELDLAPDGIARNLQVAVPTRAAADLRAPVEAILLVLPQLFVPTPAEPVGPGAKWTATTGFAYAGFDLKQTSEVKLVSRSNGGVELECSIAQAQDATVGGGERPIDKVATTSKGTFSFLPDMALPARATAQTRAEMTSKVFANGTAETALLALDLEVEISAPK